MQRSLAALAVQAGAAQRASLPCDQSDSSVLLEYEEARYSFRHKFLISLRTTRSL